MKAKTIVTISILACVGVGILVGIPQYKKSKDEEWVRIQEIRMKSNNSSHEWELKMLREKLEDMDKYLEVIKESQNPDFDILQETGEYDVVDYRKRTFDKMVKEMKEIWISYPYYDTPFTSVKPDKEGRVDLVLFEKGVLDGVTEEMFKINDIYKEREEKIKAAEQPKTFGIF